MTTAGWSRVGVVIALVAALTAAGANAAPGGFLQHRVVAGDTLATIGARYLRAPGQWQELQAVNQISDPNRLTPGSVVRVPRRLLRPAGMATAQVESAQGGATGSRSKPAPAAASNTAAPVLAAGDAVTEGTRLQVPKDGYLRLRLADGSIVRVLADSDVELKRLRGKHRGAPYESVIEVHKGKVESEVAPQPKGRVFEIQAPGAVASVRGTRFDVAVGPDRQVATAVTEGVVKLQAGRSARKRPPAARVTAGQGAVIDAQGKMGALRALPAPPDLSQLPSDFEDASLMTLQLAPAHIAGGGYEVRIARDEGLRDVVRNGVFQAERVQFATPEDGHYTLGVRVLDADGLAGAESRRTIRVHARPVPPLYQSPAPGARITQEAGQLICSDVADAAGVMFEVASQPDFGEVRLRETQRNGCRMGVASLSPGHYWWRVASLAQGAGTGEAGRGPFAAAQAVTVVATPSVGAVELDDSGDNPTLRWQAGPGERFRAQLAHDEAFTQLMADVELATPAWTITGQPHGSYFVRLQARDASGLSGPFSPARRVRIGAMVRTGTGGGLTSGDGAPVERR